MQWDDSSCSVKCVDSQWWQRIHVIRESSCPIGWLIYWTLTDNSIMPPTTSQSPLHHQQTDLWIRKAEEDQKCQHLSQNIGYGAHSYGHAQPLLPALHVEISWGGIFTHQNHPWKWYDFEVLPHCIPHPMEPICNFILRLMLKSRGVLRGSTLLGAFPIYAKIQARAANSRSNNIISINALEYKALTLNYIAAMAALK